MCSSDLRFLRETASSGTKATQKTTHLEGHGSPQEVARSRMLIRPAANGQGNLRRIVWQRTEGSAPDASNSVLVKYRVGTYQGNVLHQALGNQEPVKRVSVMEG